MGAGYARSSHAQLASHKIAFPALREAIGHVAALPREGPLRVCDFGCASGGNAIATAHHVLDELRDAGVTNVAYTCEDLPTNDWQALEKALATGGVADRTDVSFVKRSFYEPCFPRASLHLATAFISLHWLSSTPCDVGPGAVMAQDHGAPAEAVAAWHDHAHADLVAFLRLRAAELVDGGCGLFHMVGGEPCLEWIRPRSLELSVFSDAMNRAVARGELSEDAAARATVPYYMRSVAEVEAAAAECPELEVLAVPSGEIRIAEGESTATMVNLAWAIHGNSLISSTGMSQASAEAVRAQLLDVTAERFTGSEGCHTNYLAVAVRRRPR